MGATVGVDSMVAEAARYVGYCEYPPDSNRTRFGEWFGDDGVAWCDIFISYVAAHSGNAHAVGRFEGCPAHVAFFKAQGRYHAPDCYAPVRGDLAFYAWSNGVPAHVGLVISYDLQTQTFEVIEGNTSATSEDNGGTVAIRTRHMDASREGFHVCGFAHPDYLEEEMTEQDFERIRAIVRDEVANYVWGFEDRHGSSAINELANIKSRVDSNGDKLDRLLSDGR